MPSSNPNWTISFSTFGLISLIVTASITATSLAKPSWTSSFRWSAPLCSAAGTPIARESPGRCTCPRAGHTVKPVPSQETYSATVRTLPVTLMAVSGETWFYVLQNIAEQVQWNLFTDESRYMRRSELEQKCLTWFKKIDCNDTLKGVYKGRLLRHRKDCSHKSVTQYL